MKQAIFQDAGHRNSFNNLKVGQHVAFEQRLNDGTYTNNFGRVVSKWGGAQPRVLILDTNGAIHTLKDLSTIRIESANGNYYSAHNYHRASAL